MSEDAHEAPDPRLTRRRILESFAALALLGLPGSHALGAATATRVASAAAGQAAAAASGVTAASLVAAAAKLDAAALLDDSLGASYLAALSGVVGEAKLTRLAALLEATPPAELDAAIARAGLEPAAQAVVAAFYSGLVGEGSREQLVTYLMALVWGAAPFTKPPSLCGGVFGYWAEPPPGVPSQLAATPAGAK